MGSSIIVRKVFTLQLFSSKVITQRQKNYKTNLVFIVKLPDNGF